MLQRSLFAGAVSLCAAAVLVACGGSGDPIKVAASDLTVTASPATATAATAMLTAVSNGFTFPNGIPELGATGSTVLTVTGTGTTPAFSLTSGGDTVSGTLSYGSCIFTVDRVVTTNTGLSGVGTIRLTVGQKIFISLCNVVANTAGAATNTDLRPRTFLTLGTTRSDGTPGSVTVVIDRETGNITWGNTIIGTVNLIAPTGT